MLQSQAVKRLAHIADHHAAPTASQHAQNLRANKLLQTKVRPAHLIPDKQQQAAAAAALETTSKKQHNLPHTQQLL